MIFQLQPPCLPFFFDFTTKQDTSKFIEPPTPNNPTPKSSRAPSYPSTQLPIVQEFTTLSERRIPVNPLQVHLQLTNHHTPNQSCLLSWRKFLTPSTTLLPLLATHPSMTSLPTPLLTRLPMLLTAMQSWPVPQRVADSTSVTSRTRPPKGSCSHSSKDT